MYYTDNPAADFLRYDRDQEKRRKELPICDYYGEAIEDKFYEIGYETICPKCLEENFERSI